MTRVVGGLVVIEPEPPQQCDDCGEVAELRPYGPPGSDGRNSMVCHRCAMKDPEGTEARAREVLGF